MQQTQAENEPVCEELTDREVEILRLIAKGLSNEEIAERLVITRSTVGVHIGRILGKLGLSNRTQAALYALRTGIAEPEPAVTRPPLRRPPQR